MDRIARGIRWGSAAALLLPFLAGATTAGAAEPRRPGPRSACPVCGMFVEPHPAWLAQIAYDDGATVFFDGCKDLFTYLLDPERSGAGAPGDRAATVYVTSYYDGKPISAPSAFFVAGSDVLGPMGAELIPLGSRDEAEEFLEDHNGSAILRFEDIDAGVLSGLR